MHPELLKWLAIFDKDCQTRNSPTGIYNSLVMLGCERPNMPCLDIPPGTSLGCDCLTIIAEDQKNIVRCEQDIREWHSGNLGNIAYHYVLGKKEYIAKCQEYIELYTSMHQNHGLFNRHVHRSLTCNGYNLLARVRKVCLRDLRNQVKPIALASYGKELATFLRDEPKGWF